MKEINHFSHVTNNGNFIFHTYKMIGKGVEYVGDRIITRGQFMHEAVRLMAKHLYDEHIQSQAGTALLCTADIREMMGVFTVLDSSGMSEAPLMVGTVKRYKDAIGGWRIFAQCYMPDGKCASVLRHRALFKTELIGSKSPSIQDVYSDIFDILWPESED